MGVKEYKLNASKLWNEQLGFSMVELLVTLVIAGLVMTVINSVFTGQWNTWKASESQVLLKQDLQLATDIIAERVRKAVTTPTVTTTKTLTVVNKVAGADTTFVFNIDGSNKLTMTETIVGSPTPGTTKDLLPSGTVITNDLCFAWSSDNLKVDINLFGTKGDKTLKCSTSAMPRVLGFK